MRQVVSVVPLLLMCLYRPAAANVFTAEEADWLRRHPVIRIAADPDFAPVEWVDANGVLHGIASDYLKAVEPILGVRFELVPCASWDVVLEKARLRDVDMLTAAGRTPQREQYLSFSRPHIELPGVIIVRTDRANIDEIASLDGKRVAVVSGYVWQEFLETHHPNIEIVPVSSVRAGMRKVSFGLVDAMIENLATATRHLMKENIANLTVAGQTPYYSRLAFAVRSDWPLFHGIIEKAVASIPEAKRQQIYNRWIGFSGESPLRDRHLWTALAVSFLVSVTLVSGIALWNHALHRKVAERTRALKEEFEHRQRVENALVVSEHNYKQLVECANTIILMVDRKGTIQYFNEYAQHFFGYTAQEIVGQNVLGTIVPHTESSGRNLESMLHDICAAPQNYLVNENENITRSGQLRWISWANRPIRSSEGGLEQILCVGTDITERRRATLALEESERRYRFLFDESPACNVILHTDGTIYDVNNVFLNRLGYSREEMLGKSAADFLSPHAYGHLMKRLDGESGAGDVDTPMIAKDGATRYINFAAGTADITLASGQRAILISGIDVTQKHLAVEQERLQHEKLVRTDKMTTLGVLVAGVAHEINNPNNYIRLNSENLADIWDELETIAGEHIRARGSMTVRGFSYTELTAQMRRMIRGITEGADRIAAIVTSLKDFAREQPADLTEMVDINNVVRSSLLILSNMIKHATDHFSVCYDESMPLLQGNFQRIEQVVINIVGNGCQALTDKSCPLLVETAWLPHQQQVHLTVRDEGSGIPADTMKRIFDPFYTTRRETGGTGLGLPIAYRIMKEHGGELSVESAEGEGTTVTLVFPLTTDTERSIPA